MAAGSAGDWKKMAVAPRDGSRILVAVRASEQGPAEVDLVRWEMPAHAAEAAWIADDSEPDLPVIYADGELTGWMEPPERLMSAPGGRAVLPQIEETEEGGEMDGSSI